jgi:hypothetical protein
VIENRYAVIKCSLDDTNEEIKRFTTWHNTYDEAKEEAERICRKEQSQCVIVRAISKCNLDTVPIKWTE